MADASGVKTFTITTNARTVIWKNGPTHDDNLGEQYIEVTAMATSVLDGATALIQRSFIDKADTDPTVTANWETLIDENNNTKSLLVGRTYGFVTKIPFLSVLTTSGGAGLSLILKVQ